MTAGIANTIITLWTNIAQTNSGMRSRLMPGARCLRMVTIKLTALASEDSSVKVTSCAQMSMRLPGL
jgi:hypothetical protein